MGRASREMDVLELFFNYPSKHWRFSEIKGSVSISDSKISRWLKKLAQQGIVRRVKFKGRMPYYVGNYEAAEYQNAKKVFALNRFYDTGFLNHLSSLQSAKSVIIFGSFGRADWHSGSDIDIFVYGSAAGLDVRGYSERLGRAIQLFVCGNRKDFGKLGSRLIKNIMLGNIIKGDPGFLERAAKCLNS
ncbi:MAG: nucleotidyltransferase domain-containing protein [Candidatus Woesearchaeota archaeon]|nr:nucleotidyltransferase domain-containing protein [Candidatus Woesearchaeota archaeon]